MCPESPKLPLKPCPNSLERLLPWSRIHGILGEVMEQNAIHRHKANQAPLHDLCPLVPGWLYRFHSQASLEFALESKLLLFCELPEVRRPLLQNFVAVSREVEGWEIGLRRMAKQSLDELEHCVGLKRVRWRDQAVRELNLSVATNDCLAKSPRRRAAKRARFWSDTGKSQLL